MEFREEFVTIMINAYQYFADFSFAEICRDIKVMCRAHRYELLFLYAEDKYKGRIPQEIASMAKANDRPVYVIDVRNISCFKSFCEIVDDLQKGTVLMIDHISEIPECDDKARISRCFSNLFHEEYIANDPDVVLAPTYLDRLAKLETIVIGIDYTDAPGLSNPNITCSRYHLV